MKLSAALSSPIFTPDQVLVLGFEVIAGLPDITENDETDANIAMFKGHYGPSPTTVAIVWSDIVEEKDIGVPVSEKNRKGFKRFLIALHFLWAYPKNGMILASTTGVSLRSVQGENLWKWVKVIGGLKQKVITWPGDEYNRPDRHFLLTVDGVDFRTWEKSTEDRNVDPKTMSHKFRHGALKYEIGIDCFNAKIVWIDGPWRAGKGDREIFAQDGGLREKIPEGKLVVCDRVYTDKKYDDNAGLALPNVVDSKEFFRWKSRMRSRHESLNGRLKDYRILFDLYHHDPDNHVFAFEAVAVVVQYAMDHGHPIFDANTIDPNE